MATKTDKPWGYELLWSHTDHYAGKVIHINAGQRLSLQYHNQKHESVLVLSGTLLLQLGTGDSAELINLEPGESHDIPVSTVHRFAAPPNADVRIIEVSTPELDDVVRLDDDYQRA